MIQFIGDLHRGHFKSPFSIHYLMHCSW